MSGKNHQIYQPFRTSQFKEDVERMRNSGRKSLDKKFSQICLLLLDRSLENQIRLKNFRDHNLSGEWEGFRELHIQADWLIIYSVDHEKRKVYFVRTGTHSELFG